MGKLRNTDVTVHFDGATLQLLDDLVFFTAEEDAEVLRILALKPAGE